MRTCFGFRPAFAAAAALIAAVLALPAGASAQEIVAGKLTLAGPYGGAAKRHAMITTTNPDGTVWTTTAVSEDDGTMVVGAPAGATVSVVLRGQDATSENVWSFDDCPVAYAPPQDELTVTLQARSPDEPSADDNPSYISPRNLWSLQVKPVVYELTEPGVNAAEQRFVDLLNAERSRNGLGPVTVQPRLSATADAQATAVATIPALEAHGGAGCEEPYVRFVELGGAPTSVSEVKYGGAGWCSSTAEEAFNSLMLSKPHRGIMLSPSSRYAGVAYVEGYWIATFIANPEQVTHPLPPLTRRTPRKGGCGGTSAPPTAEPVVLRPPPIAAAGSTITLRGTGTPGAKVTVVVDEREGKAANKTLTATVDEGGTWAARVKATREAQLTANDGASTATRTLRVRADFAGVAAKRIRGGVRVAGTVRPGDTRATVTVRIGARKLTVRTRSGGRFSAMVRVSARNGAKVTLAVAADKGSYAARTETAKAR